MDALSEPRERSDQIGRESVEAHLSEIANVGALTHGWIIKGGEGVGKATLAYRLARGLLDPNARLGKDSFNVDPDEKVFRLIAGEAHPDLFVLQRPWDEKNSRYKSEIPVDSVRDLISFLNRTPALGRMRVAIIDTADHLNRNGANALLKALEEPPKNTALFLLSTQPGRLPATVRSRCKVIELRPLAGQLVVDLLEREGLASESNAKTIAAHAGGRPGFALRLAAEDGAAAITLCDKFLSRIVAGNEPDDIIASLAPKSADNAWAIFRATMLQSLMDSARAAASQRSRSGPLKDASAQNLLRAWETASTLLSRGEALNVDRGQILAALNFDMAPLLRSRV